MIRQADQTEISPDENGTIHSRIEIGNVFRSNRILREWINTPQMPSNYAVTLLHANLFNGVKTYGKKGLTPNSPGDYRLEDIKVSGEPENFYVRGLEIRYLMRDYTAQLDSIIDELPTAPEQHIEQIIGNAAWAYYTFIRIHPFLDGNGRVSRFVLQRVLKGAGFKDVIFSEEASLGKKRFLENRNRHLDTLNQVDKTGNLAYLEVYLASLLLSRYGEGDLIYKQLKEFIENKRQSIHNQKTRMDLTDIWGRFKDVDISGVEESLVPSN